MFEYIVNDFEAFDLSEKFTTKNYNKIFYYECDKVKFLVFYNSVSGLVRVDLYKESRKSVLDSSKKLCTLKEIKSCVKIDLYFLKYKGDLNIEILKLFFDEADRKEFILKQERIAKAIDQREEIEKLEAAKKMTEEVKQKKMSQQSKADKVKKYKLFYEIEETLYSIQQNLRGMILREDIQTLSLEQLESALVYFKVVDREIIDKSFTVKHDMKKVREAKAKKTLSKKNKLIEELKEYILKNNIKDITVTEICNILNINRQYFYRNKFDDEMTRIFRKD